MNRGFYEKKREEVRNCIKELDKVNRDLYRLSIKDGVNPTEYIKQYKTIRKNLIELDVSFIDLFLKIENRNTYKEIKWKK